MTNFTAGNLIENFAKNSYKNHMLIPTLALGGIGGVVGGFSDDGSVLGGAAKGAMFGAGFGAARKFGSEQLMKNENLMKKAHGYKIGGFV